jgi:GH15 family glucan-1,4-alpha-glucosidase
MLSSRRLAVSVMGCSPDPTRGAHLGNYPLALSQAGLVHAVLEVQKVLDA